jgi:uncharacterized protein
MVSGLIGQLPMVSRTGHLAHFRECSVFLGAAALSMPAGLYLLSTGDAAAVRRVVGFGTIVMALLLLLGWAYRGKRTLRSSATFGALTGMLGGATGQGGPLAVAYFMAAPVEVERQRANIVMTVTGLTLVLLVGLGAGGILSAKNVLGGVCLAAPFTLGTVIGGRLFEYLPLPNYRLLVVALLIAAGAAAMLRL